MITFKVIDKVTHDEVSPEFVTDNAGAFFALAESGQLFVCWRDAWNDYEMLMMDMDEIEVIANETCPV